MISVFQLDTIDYATGLRLQRQLVELRKQEKIGDVLLLLEHTPVITLGRNAKSSNIIASPEFLNQRGVELFESDRGGDVTFHGPGQLVGYPIFDLRGFRVQAEANPPARSNALSSRASPSESDGESRDLMFPLRKRVGAVDFVRCLEQVLIRTCADFAIPTKRICGLTGVWTDTESTTDHVRTAAPGCPVEQSSIALDAISLRADHVTLSTRVEEDHSQHAPLESRDVGLSPAGKPLDFSRTHTAVQSEAPLAAEGNKTEAKLAAIGVHISRFVTSHGFALNVNTDLSYFNLIVPCGITSKPVTSMEKELGRALDLNAVAESVSRNFGFVFQTQILWLESLDALLCSTGALAHQNSNAQR